MKLLVWACIFVTLKGCVRSNTQIITCGEFQPKMGLLKSIIHEIPPEYEVTFSVKPTAFPRGYANVVHFTTGGDSTKLGYNIPGVWFLGDQLRIDGPVENTPDFYAISQHLEKNKWTDVKISSTKHGKMYWYAVVVNGKTIIGTDNPSFQTFKNVKVYVSDPWTETFKGILSNLRIKLGGSTQAIIDTRVPTQTIFCGEAKKGNLVATITSIPPAYEIIFSVKPTAFTDGYSNVFHFTTGGDYGKLGYRIPGVWFNQDKLHIFGSVENDANFLVKSQRLETNKWTDVKISSKKHGSMYWYAVVVNGKTIMGTDNPSFQTFTNVKVYVSDPWYPPFKGVLSNLQIKVGE